MEPLSRRTRATYFFVLSALFLAVLPFAILYAAGYRFSDLSFVPTGGIFVVAPVSEVLVTLNGKEVGTTNIFDRSFYLDNLLPGTYVVQASLDGYYPWAKTLAVEPSVVTDVSAFLVPEELTVTELLLGTTTATSTRGITTSEREEYLRAFAPPTTTPRSLPDVASSTPVDTRNGQALYIEDGNLALRWLKNASSTPSGFCVTPSSCVTEFFLEEGREDVTAAQFFRLGALYRTSVGSLYYAETDVRPSPLTVKIYSAKGAEFRVISGTLIVKEGTALYEVSGF